MKLDINERPQVNFGDTLTCTETGKQFVAARDECFTNYALIAENAIFSDEGVNIRELRGMSQRPNVFYCYVDSHANSVTGWKGNKLGTISNYDENPSGWHGATIARFRVLDASGNWWQGRGAGKNMCCTLRPMKTPRH